MRIDFSSPEKEEFTLVDYIGKFLDDLTEDMKGDSESQSAHHLLGILDKPTQLSKED